ncbi:MAG: hypothetical protein ABJB61_10620 [bacterium]
MKSLIKQVAIALVIASLTAASAFAKTRTQAVSFTSNTTVNGTLVKRGNYQLKFDEEKGELSIVKDGKVIAQAATSKENRTGKAHGFEMRMTGSGDEQRLIGIAFSGSNQNIVLNGSSASR